LTKVAAQKRLKRPKKLGLQWMTRPQNRLFQFVAIPLVNNVSGISGGISAAFWWHFCVILAGVNAASTGVADFVE
jgi:hypothetical protein